MAEPTLCVCVLLASRLSSSCIMPESVSLQPVDSCPTLRYMEQSRDAYRWEQAPVNLNVNRNLK